MKLASVVIVGFAVLALAAPICAAQDHDRAEVGVFADYFRLQALPRDLFGVGARAGWNVHYGPMHGLALEAEVAYDFERNFSETFTRGIATSFAPSNARALHGLFGPKLQFGRHLRPFVTAKGGFLNVGFTSANAPIGFNSAITQLRNNNNGNGVFYGGGGVEWFWGRLGLRLDAGDEIYFSDGAHSNVKATFGPHIRF